MESENLSDVREGCSGLFNAFIRGPEPSQRDLSAVEHHDSAESPECVKGFESIQRFILEPQPKPPLGFHNPFRQSAPLPRDQTLRPLPSPRGAVAVKSCSGLRLQEAKI